jgi:hypothetical protein
MKAVKGFENPILEIEKCYVQAEPEYYRLCEVYTPDIDSGINEQGGNRSY